MHISDSQRSMLSLFDHQWNELLQREYSGQEELTRACRYALDGSGKRIRALFAMMIPTLYEKNPRLGLSAATAVEMIHAYSLAHDDLPCMDNDDWRRGRPSLHSAFNDATALLAGDALLTDAFRALTDTDFFPDASLVAPEDRATQVHILASASGSSGMVLGQARDLWWTNRGAPSPEDLNLIHIEKTGALIGASCALGAVAAGASKKDIAAFLKFGRLVGVAFQAIDDILDTTSATGKSQGKDVVQGKLTYLKFYSVREVKTLAQRHSNEALTCLPENLKNIDTIGAFMNELVFRSR